VNLAIGKKAISKTIAATQRGGAMKRLLFVLTIALVALSLNSAPVAAQAVGATDVDIELEGIVILHYFSEVDITISAVEMGAYVLGAGTAAFDEGQVTGSSLGTMTWDLNMTPSGLGGGSTTAADLTLQDAWAVRSIGGPSNETTLSVRIDQAILTEGTGTGATISMTAASVSNGGAPGNPITFASPGLVVPEEGDVILTLDLTNAVAAGFYNDGVFELTASII
jgi:hypothetical protein